MTFKKIFTLEVSDIYKGAYKSSCRFICEDTGITIISFLGIKHYPYSSISVNGSTIFFGENFRCWATMTSVYGTTQTSALFDMGPTTCLVLKNDNLYINLNKFIYNCISNSQ